MYEQLLQALKNRYVSNIKQHNAYIYYCRYEAFLTRYRSLDPATFSSAADYKERKNLMSQKLNNASRKLYNFIWNSKESTFDLPGKAKGGK